MTHFGILCPPTTGHLNTMIPLGQELQKRGHRLTYFGVLDAKPRILAAGFEFQALGTAEFPTGKISQSLTPLQKLSGFAALQHPIELIRYGVSVFLREAPTAMREAGIEALLVDQASLEGGSIADRLQIPFVSVCSALPFNQEDGVPPFFTPWNYQASTWTHWRNRLGYGILNRVMKPIWDVIAEYRQQWQLRPYTHPNDAYSPMAHISQQPAEFEFPRTALPSSFHFTGPYYSSSSRQPVAFPFEKLTGQPLVYASMGTLQNDRQTIFHSIAESCLGLDIQLVISLGGAVNPEALPELPGSPLIVGYAPQLELLSKAALTINHAGTNTVLEALSHGVPMVSMPVTNDQPGVGTRLAWVGAGEVIPLARLEVSRLRTAIHHVLTQASYKENALRLQTAIHQTGGVRYAADVVEKVALTGKAVIA